MTTALELITGSLRLLGVVGAGQVASPEDTATGLTALNELLEALSIDHLAVYTPSTQTFALVASTASYTVGPSGTWSGFRPTELLQMRVTYSGIDYEVQYLDNEHFNQIPLKTQPGIIPQWFSYDADVPNGIVTLWPVPSQALAVYLTCPKQLTQIAALNTVLVLPPGYKRMLRYNLARDLQEEYGKPMSPEALRIAATSLGGVKRANMDPQRADFDPALTGRSGTGYRLGDFMGGNY